MLDLVRNANCWFSHAQAHIVSQIRSVFVALLFSSNEQFLDFVGALPLRGTIPDMTSDSDRYIQLQQVYRDQADQDVAIVTQKVHDLLQEIGRVSGGVVCMRLRAE